jgi:hypothetical protein
MPTQNLSFNANHFDQLTHYEMNRIRGGDDPITPPSVSDPGKGGTGDG